MGSITASRGLTIGALSRLTDVNVETIRYYERIKLMRKPPRTGGGHRSYEREHVEHLRFIRRARTLGFGIDGVRALLRLSSCEANSCAEARAIASAHLAEVRAKRDDLNKLERVLAETIAQCDARCCGPAMPICPILEVLGS
jgi:MerR family mercuric resistance operon transcriptional regulator